MLFKLFLIKSQPRMYKIFNILLNMIFKDRSIEDTIICHQKKSIKTKIEFRAFFFNLRENLFIFQLPNLDKKKFDHNIRVPIDTKIQLVLFIYSWNQLVLI